MPKTKDMNLVKLIDQFHSEDSCRDYLEQLRWPDKIQCVRCNSAKIGEIQGRGQYVCYSCNYHFSVTTSTIFHDTHLPLWKWFLATYTMVESKKGVSAKQIERTIDISYKTAWYLCHRIRAAMTELNAEKLSGTVEVDETWIGGKLKGYGKGKGNYSKNKTLVIGIIQRDGDIRLKVIKRADRKTLHKFIQDHTEPDTEMVITDEWQAYKGIADHDTKHETINHSRKEYVRGNIHTNGIENVWSLLKRSVVGTYHKLSAKHLDAYLDELEWRFNNRQNPYLFRDTLKKMISSDRLEYRNLIAS